MNARACRSVGIDLGTTYSSLAYMDAHSQPRVVADSSGQTVVPSVIFFDESEVIVGDIALENAKIHADRVVQFVKCHMGDDWRKEIGGRIHTPESLSAMILAHLVRESEPQIGAIPSAVITVPAYFSEKRRRATQQAGEIAGLEVVGVLNEPMSAALAYGLHREEKEQTVLIYDLGGGTFDVTIVKITPQELEELATYGNRQLGGKDWDQCLIDHVADDFQRVHHTDPRQSPQVMQNLQIQCERAKRQLAKMMRTVIAFSAFGKAHEVEISRARFEELTAHLLKMTKLTVEMALEDAGLSWDRLQRVLLVGGSTHMPMVRLMLQGLSGYPPDTGVNPVIAVALGASLYAHMLDTDSAPKAIHLKPVAPGHAGQSQAGGAGPAGGGGSASAAPAAPQADLSLPNVRFVTAHGVGIRVLTHEGRPINQVLIPRNHAVPTTSTWHFLTQRNKGISDRLKIVVTQGDADDPALVEILGTLYISGIPRDEQGGQPVDITMSFDRQGRLHINAIYLNTGQSLQQSLEIPGGLRQEQVQEFRRLLETTGLIRSESGRSSKLDSIVLLDDEEDDELPLVEPF
jgi:molecular chaperone DnaK